MRYPNGMSILTFPSRYPFIHIPGQLRTMRKLLMILLFVPAITFAQKRLHLTAFGGFANYQGDLQSKRFTLEQSAGAFGIGLKYDVTSHLSVRTGFNYGRVEGDDKKNKAVLQLRNLSFQTTIVEANLLAEYTLFDLEDKRISPYAFAGVGIFHFNPFAFDSVGNKIYLQPLGTEGQGLSQYNRDPYKKTQFAIPFGGGVKFRVTENAVLGFEIGMRKLFTDYLDDVSKTYVNEIALGLARGPKAVEMAYRGGEVKNGDPLYPAEGTLRGSEKFKDWYYFSGLTLSVGIGDGNLPFINLHGTRERKVRSSVDCPKIY